MAGGDPARHPLAGVHEHGERQRGDPLSQQQQISKTFEDDAQVVSNTELDELLTDEPRAVQDEILKINTDATNLALQVALLIPILAGGLGLFDSFRMMRLPEIKPSGLGRGSSVGLTCSREATPNPAGT